MGCNNGSNTAATGLLRIKVNIFKLAALYEICILDCVALTFWLVLFCASPALMDLDIRWGAQSMQRSVLFLSLHSWALQRLSLIPPLHW